MRAPPPRHASAQVTTQPPSSTITTQRYGTTLRAAADPTWLLHYQDWQAWARRYTRQIGTASFAANVAADSAARTILQVEERHGDDWEPSDNPLYTGIFDAYCNALQLTPELIRLHSWHYNVAGEMLQVQRDGLGGQIDYSIHSTAAAVWDQPQPGLVTIKLVPDGKVDAGTAFVVPREQVVRFWIPDQEWQAFAWSPMAASIDDLHRWRALSRYAWRTADSQLAMNGLLWTPTGAHMTPPPEDEAVPDEQEIGTPRSLLQEQYMSAAKMRFSDDEDIAAVAPYMVHWDKDEGLPTWLDLGKGLDKEGIAHRQEALEDFARATSLPNTMVMGGGVGTANHWSEWLATDKFYSSAIAPTMERICYTDLTRTFLWPRLTLEGFSPDQLAGVRVGFDPSPVIVKPDKSQMALEALRIGAISYDSAREAMGFNETDAPTDADIHTLIEVTRSRVQEQAQLPPVSNVPAGSGPPSPLLPVGPGNVSQTPPGGGRAQPPPPETTQPAPTVANVATLLATVLGEALEDADADAD